MKANSDSVFWNVHFPANKTTVNGPQEILDISNSISLKGKAYSFSRFGALYFEKGDDLNYTDYYNFIFAKDAASADKFKMYMHFFD